MGKLVNKWCMSFGVLFLALALLITIYPSSADAAYSANMVPVMTGNNSSGAIASASSEYPNHPAWHAFDDDPNTAWIERDSSLGWLAIELPVPKIVTKFSFVSQCYDTYINYEVPAEKSNLKLMMKKTQNGLYLVSISKWIGMSQRQCIKNLKRIIPKHIKNIE